MTTWNDVKRHRGEAHARRWMAYSTFVAGKWVCHSLTGIWIELVAIDGELCGGFGIRGEEHIFPWAECYHAWVPEDSGGNKKFTK